MVKLKYIKSIKITNIFNSFQKTVSLKMSDFFRYWLKLVFLNRVILGFRNERTSFVKWAKSLFFKWVKLYFLKRVKSVFRMREFAFWNEWNLFILTRKIIFSNWLKLVLSKWVKSFFWNKWNPFFKWMITVFLIEWKQFFELSKIIFRNWANKFIEINGNINMNWV